MRISNLAIAVGLAFLPISAAAFPGKSIANVEGWELIADKTNLSCYAQTTSDQGFTVLMTASPKVNAIYFMVEGKADFLKDGVITIEAGGKEFEMPAQAMKYENLSGAWFQHYPPGYNDKKYFSVGNFEEIVVNPNGDKAYAVSLNGAKAAIEAAEACVKSELLGQ